MTAPKHPLVPKPCPEDWDQLTPTEQGHHCQTCKTKVWDISSMTRGQAEAFLARHTDHLCVSYRERSNGEIVYAPEPVVPAGRLTRLLPAAAAGLSLALAACTAATPEKKEAPKPEERQIKGDRAPARPPADIEADIKKGKVAQDPEPKPEITKGKVTLDPTPDAEPSDSEPVQGKGEVDPDALRPKTKPEPKLKPKPDPKPQTKKGMVHRP